MQARIVQREIDEAVLDAVRQLNLHPAAEAVLAGRASKHGVDPAALLNCALRDLDSPASLPDIQVGSDRVVAAIQLGEVIGLETDHDVDGVTSHAVLVCALTALGHPREKIRSYIGHRLNEGYGLSDALCDRILSDEIRPALIITADNGSSDALRIARLREHGIDTVVTDHHSMPAEGPPAAAVACISPIREDSQFPDRYIAGVMVSFLLMCYVRQQMIDRNLLPDSTPRLSSLLDFVALGTVADCVSLARSLNNRAVIRAGVRPISEGSRPCWRAIRPYLGDQAKPLSSSDLAFGIGPRINAVGRLDDAMVGVNFLLSETDEEAARWAKELDDGNLLRREIESDLKEEAMIVGGVQAEIGRSILQVCLSEGHAGVHGIVASRLVESFGRSAICFSVKVGEPDVLTGSARGVEGVPIDKAMQLVEDRHPGLLLKFGGHEGAGGLSIRAADLSVFESAMEKVVSELVSGATQEPLTITDGMLSTDLINNELVDALQAIEPFGREFETPVFEGHFKMMSCKAMGQDKQHWRFNLVGFQGGIFEGVWFNAGSTSPISMNGFYKIAFSPDLNWWNGRAKLQLLIRNAEPAPDVRESYYAS